jgi:hypothetical protein
MGKVKDQALNQVKDTDDDASEFFLKEEEFNYIINVNIARNAIQQEYHRVMSAFLHYIAASRLGYETTDNLKFELDFDDTTHKLRVWKLDDQDLTKPE